jgi:hypothetical protein
MVGAGRRLETEETVMNERAVQAMKCGAVTIFLTAAAVETLPAWASGLDTFRLLAELT